MSKPAFNPNKPFEAVAQASGDKPAFDPSLPFEEKQPQEESFLDTVADFGVGAIDSATMGFSDEIEAATKAAYKKSMGDPRSFEEIYKTDRDQDRADSATRQERSPWAYGAGGVAGAIGTALIPGLGALNAGKAATFAGRAGLAAAQGGLSGLGQSTAEDVGGMAKDTVIGAGMGAALQGVGEKVLAPAAKYVGRKISGALSKTEGATDWALKKMGKQFANIPEEYTEKYLKNPDSINNALDREDLAAMMFKKSSDKINMDDLPENAKRFASDEGAGILQRLDEARGEYDNDAWRTLSKKANVDKTELVNDIRFNVRDGVLKNGIEDSAIRLSNGVGGSAQEIAALEEALAQIEAAGGKNFSEHDLKKIVQGIRQKAYAEAGGARSGNTAKGLNRVADHIDQEYLKTKNLAYAKAMEPNAKATRLQTYLENKLLNKTNPDDHDKFYQQLNRWKNSGEEKMFKKQIFDLDRELNSNVAEQFDNTLAKEAFTKGNMNGSRNTMLGHAVGSAGGGIVGAVVGGPAGFAIGGLAGNAAGAAIGHATDKFAGQIMRKILDGKIATDKGMQLLAPKLGKFAKPLMDAAKRGPKALAVTHFLLSQRNPEFRKIMSEEDK